MSKSRTFSVLGLSLAVSLVLVGCSSDATIGKDELERAKNSKMTDADRAKVAAGMAEGAAKAKQQELDWAKAHPTEAARINAERAKDGRPPLGG